MQKSRIASLIPIYVSVILTYFSYYGSRAILVLYMISEVVNGGLSFGDEFAYSQYAIIGVLSSVLAFPMGILSDFVVGHRKAIFWGGLVMSLGLFVTPLYGENSLLLGMGVMAVGLGLIKPNLAVITGWHFKRDDKKRNVAYLIYYLCINIGALLAPLSILYVAETYSWGFGFFASGLAVLFVPFVFKIGTRGMSLKGIEKEGEKSTFQNLREGDILDESFENFSSNVSNKNGVFSTKWLSVMIVTVLVSFFWLMFEYLGSPLNSFIAENPPIAPSGTAITPEFQMTINPLLIIPLVIVLSLIFYFSKQINTWLKFGLGFLVFGASYYYINQLNPVVSEGNTFSPLITMYFLHTVAELLIAAIAISYVSKLSSIKLASTVMGLFFCTGFFAHQFAKRTYFEVSLIPFDSLFFTCGITCITIGFILILFSNKLKSLSGNIA